MADKQKKSGLKPKLQKAKAKFFKTYYSNPAKDLKIVVTTGTNGRDITAHYLQEILKGRDKRTGHRAVHDADDESVEARELGFALQHVRRDEHRAHILVLAGKGRDALAKVASKLPCDLDHDANGLFALLCHAHKYIT